MSGGIFPICDLLSLTIIGEMVKLRTEINKGSVYYYWRIQTYCRFKLGDNCIVFENFTASIGDFMVAN